MISSTNKDGEYAKELQSITRHFAVHFIMIVYRTINGIDFGVDVNKGAGLLCTKDIADLIDGDIYAFVEYLYQIQKTYVPMIATWEITNLCNFKCPFCYINTPQKGAPCVQTFERMRKYIDDLVSEGLLIVYLTGGEVLSVPDFVDIYRYIKEKGVFVVLLTNLSLLNEVHLNLFDEYPPMRITTSIYGVSQKQFTRVTGQNFEMCQTILQNIVKIKKRGIKITCQMPVNTYTSGDLNDIAKWCYDNNIRFTFNNEMTDSYYNESRRGYVIDNKTFDDLKSTIKQVDVERTSIIPSIKKGFGYKHHFECVSGKHTFAISYNTHLRPCFNIFECNCQYFDATESMKNAMNKMKNYINKMQNIILEGCNGCEAHEICGECIYTKLKHKDDWETYIKAKCTENRIKINEMVK